VGLTQNINACMLGEGEITITELVGLMMDNDNKLPTHDILKKVHGMALRNNEELRQEIQTQLSN